MRGPRRRRLRPRRARTRGGRLRHPHVRQRAGSLAMTAIYRNGSDEQKAQRLPGMATGGIIGSFALTEPGAGSDPASIRPSPAGTVPRERCSRTRFPLGKLNNAREAIAICRQARTIIGGNGITLDYSPLRHADNLESVRTYEGTDEVHELILGQHITGESAFN